MGQTESWIGAQGFGGAIHPGGQGDTIRQLIHRSGGGGGAEEEDSASWATPSHWGGGGKLCVGRGASFSFKDFRNHKNRDCGAILFSVFFLNVFQIYGCFKVQRWTFFQCKNYATMCYHVICIKFVVIITVMR